jgi:hypothetical protein
MRHCTISNKANDFHTCKKEASLFSTVPSVVCTFVLSHMDGPFRGLKDVASELSRQHFTYSKNAVFSLTLSVHI